MRLVCPSCRAEYEIDGALVPAPGREVQCASCGHQWFQPADEAGEPPRPPAPDRAPATQRDAAPATENHDDDEGEPPRPPPPRRKVDPEVLAVLREEALRERQARQAASRGDTPAEVPAAPADPEPIVGPGPDTEVVDTALRTIAEREHAASVSARMRAGRRRRRYGFRTGLALALLVGLLVLAAYLFAAPLAELTPTLAPLIEAVAAAVERLRATAAAAWASLRGVG